MYKQEFCNRLSTLRTLKNVSAREMSLSLGQNPSYINHIENGQTLPSMRGFFYICDYLKITPVEFFEFDNQFPNHYQHIISNLKSLNLEELESIDKIISLMAQSKNTLTP